MLHTKTVNHYRNENNSRFQVLATNSEDLTTQYKAIYQQHKIDNKWILMINPENTSLEKLQQNTDIDTRNILRVNASKTNVNLANIESAFCHGTCSAIVLCNACLEQDELAKLQNLAKRSQTTCVILNNQTVH